MSCKSRLESVSNLWLTLSLGLCLVLSSAASGNADEDKPAPKVTTGDLNKALEPPPAGASSTAPVTGEPEVDVPTGEWTIKFIDKNPSPKPSLLPKDAGLQVLHDFRFTGARLDNEHLLGNFSSESEWYVQRGYLLPVDKKDSALRIATVEDFELEGIWNAEGRGGWFLMFGYHDGHGYVLENTQFISKESGSPWHLAELRGGQGIKESFFEVVDEHLFEWKEDQPVRLAIRNKELSLKVGKSQLLKDVPLPNYGVGDVIVGTFKGRYDPKPLKIKSLRIRAVK
ncbi:MAG: hypothetical protein R3C11_10595 [Planctomycetaceae bacterium]